MYLDMLDMAYILYMHVLVLASSFKIRKISEKFNFCYDRGGFPGDTLDRVRKYEVNAQELVTTSSTRLLVAT